MNTITSKISNIEKQLKKKAHNLKEKKSLLRRSNASENHAKIQQNILKISKNIELLHKAKKELHKAKQSKKNKLKFAQNEEARERNRIETNRLRNELNKEELVHFNEIMSNLYNSAFEFIQKSMNHTQNIYENEHTNIIEIPTRNNMNNRNKNRHFYLMFDDYVNYIITENNINKKKYVTQFYNGLLNEVINMYTEYNSNIENTLLIYTNYIESNINIDEILQSYFDNYMNENFYGGGFRNFDFGYSHFGENNYPNFGENNYPYKKDKYSIYTDFKEQLYEQIEIYCIRIINDMELHSELGLNNYHFLLEKDIQPLCEKIYEIITTENDLKVQNLLNTFIQKIKSHNINTMKKIEKIIIETCRESVTIYFNKTFLKAAYMDSIDKFLKEYILKSFNNFILINLQVINPFTEEIAELTFEEAKRIFNIEMEKRRRERGERPRDERPRDERAREERARPAPTATNPFLLEADFLRNKAALAAIRNEKEKRKFFRTKLAIKYHPNRAPNKGNQRNMNRRTEQFKNLSSLIS